MTQQNDDRKQILARIRKALTVPAPKSSQHAPEAAPASSPAFQNQLPILNNGAPADFQQWLPHVGESWEEQAALFAANAAELKAEFILCESEAELAAQMQKLKDDCGWTRVAAHSGELTLRVLAELQLPVVSTDNGYDVTELESCDVGITECEALVAQTGSVLVTNRTCGGRALSVLPPHHVVLARREQLLPDLSAALHLLQSKYSDNYPTMMSFITGPSRTGDIERILVLGAHGPKRLTIFCW